MFRSTVFWMLSGLLAANGSALADSGRRPIKLLATVPIPGSPLLAFDISWIDSGTQTYYLADRSNAAIDVVDAKHNTFVRQIAGGFRGFSGNNDTSGPNGVAVSGHWLFASDAGSRVVSIDLRTDTVVAAAFTGGAPELRADELAYDAADGVLLVVNNADSPPFATLIHVNKQTGHLTVGRRITFTTATNGAEQPVWDPGTRRFYVSIPEIGGSAPDGAVGRINLDGTLERLFPVTNCQPAGLALGPDQDLLLGCSVVFDTAGQPWSPADALSAAPIQVIMDARTGAIDANVAGVSGSDEVWFNPGDRHFYTASRANPGGPALGVIDARRQTLVQVVPTFNTPASAPAPRGTSHSLAANPHNNHVFLALPANNVFPSCLNGCIGVFGAQDDDDDHD
jgi:DNA-binding beta-propeller fold protein YncE